MGKTHVDVVALDGLGAGWGNPVRLNGYGRSGEFVTLTVRGDVADNTNGTAEVKVFTAIPPNHGSMVDNHTALLAALDPDAILDEHVFLHVTGLTVTDHATDVSESVNLRDVTQESALYARPDVRYQMWASVKGVTGIVYVGFKAEGD